MNDHPKADAKASPRPPQITAEATITTSSPDGHHDDQTRSETLPGSATAIISTIQPRSSPASPDGPNDDDQIVGYIGGSAGSADDDRDDLGHVDQPTNHRSDQATSIADIRLRLSRTDSGSQAGATFGDALRQDGQEGEGSIPLLGLELSSAENTGFNGKENEDSNLQPRLAPLLGTNISEIVEKAQKSSHRRSLNHVCYGKLLRKSSASSPATSQKTAIQRQTDCYLALSGR